jgi:hypothetical protein
MTEAVPPDDLSALEPKKVLTPQAQRALAEAAERRARAEAEAQRAKEEGGPGGPEPTRYGDWERKGIAVDF